MSFQSDIWYASLTYKLTCQNDLVLLYPCFIVMITGKFYMNYQSKSLNSEESNDGQRCHICAFTVID